MTHTERLHALLQTFDGAMRDVLKHAIKERDEYWAKELEVLQAERERCDEMANLLYELEEQRLIAWISKSWWERRDKILTSWKATHD